MRKIKFRGRCVITGNWAYGYYYPSKGNYIIRDAEDKETIVMPESVGQFTGLKDKNGTEIYDGDIMKGFPEGTIGVVKYSDSQHGFWMYQDMKTTATYWSVECEVIGNTHENPELIESKS